MKLSMCRHAISWSDQTGTERSTKSDSHTKRGETGRLIKHARPTVARTVTCVEYMLVWFADRRADVTCAACLLSDKAQRGNWSNWAPDQRQKKKGPKYLDKANMYTDIEASRDTSCRVRKQTNERANRRWRRAKNLAFDCQIKPNQANQANQTPLSGYRWLCSGQWDVCARASSHMFCPSGFSGAQQVGLGSGGNEYAAAGTYECQTCVCFLACRVAWWNSGRS